MENKKRVFIFHHTDLDGMGVRIVGTEYAKKHWKAYETVRCSYESVNSNVLDVLDNVPLEEIDEILIGDISVNEEVAERLDALYNSGTNVILRDHHATAEWLNKYEWAEVHEEIDGVSRCGTWQLATCFPEVFKAMLPFVFEVDSWDTWKWKENDNLKAKNLNALHKIMGDELFVKYIMDLGHIISPEKLFNETAKLLIEIHENDLKKDTLKCENNMILTTIKVGRNIYTCGLIYASNNFSEIADNILTKHQELDILGVINLPNSISWRTQQDLPTPLGVIAKLATGIGGGHPKASGSGLPKSLPTDLVKYLFKDSDLNIRIVK